ncbi:MAG TPA: hypothetical protein VEP90_20570, partial [Methylomirabilota bacterium]|nr:hypothetical protein [Methylomirabilota bacterium]
MYNTTSLPSDCHISLLGASTMHLSYPGIKLRIVELIEKLTKEQHIIKQAEFPAMGLQKNSAQNARYLRG